MSLFKSSTVRFQRPFCLSGGGYAGYADGCAQVNFDKIWDGMQPQLTSLVSGAPQTLSNDKWMGMYSYVASAAAPPVGSVLRWR
jgi:hypothetical protein